MRQVKKSVSKTKQQVRKSKANSFMALATPDYGDAVLYGGGDGNGSAVTTTQPKGTVTPSVDPDYITQTNLDPIVSEVMIIPGSGILVNPDIKSPADSPIIPIGVLTQDPSLIVEPPPPPKLPDNTQPVELSSDALQPTVEKKVWPWLLLVVITALSIYFLARKK